MVKFYALVKRGWVDIPASKVKEVVRKGRRFAVGKYTFKGKEYEAWKVLGTVKKATKTDVKKVVKTAKKKGCTNKSCTKKR